MITHGQHCSFPMVKVTRVTHKHASHSLMHCLCGKDRAPVCTENKAVWVEGATELSEMIKVVSCERLVFVFRKESSSLESPFPSPSLWSRFCRMNWKHKDVFSSAQEAGYGGMRMESL